MFTTYLRAQGKPMAKKYPGYLGHQGTLLVGLVVTVAAPSTFVRASKEPCVATDGGGCNGGRSVYVECGESSSGGETTGDTTGSTTMVASICGDGMQAADEQCDDGNLKNGDGCDAQCQTEPTTCGDMRCDDGEVCPEDCPSSVCGDGEVDDGEDCDDRNEDSTDACVMCKSAVCGDGFVQQGVEDCDDQNDDDTDACVSCKAAACGDGFIQKGVETCDDGAANSDAYAAQKHCNATCSGSAPYCGDGVADAREACDGAPETGCVPGTCARAESCMAFAGQGLASGIYHIFPTKAEAPIKLAGVDVYCDLDSDGGGYTFLKVDVSNEGNPSPADDAELRCGTYGMGLWIPRSAAHVEVSWAVATGDELKPITGGLASSPDYMTIAGIYAKQAGASCQDANTFQGEPLNSVDCPEWVGRGATPYWVSDKPGKDVNIESQLEPGKVNCTDCSMQLGWTAPGKAAKYDAIDSPGASSKRFFCDIADKLP